MPPWIKVAHKESANGVHHSHLLGAVIVRGGAVLAKAANRSPIHAEVRAIKKAGDCQGAVLFVVRRTLSMSRPCPNCMANIKNAGIKKIVYLDWHGEVQEERL